jgi:ABC-type glycerol-3-phosphate transport system substrate-binding protein
MIKSVWRLIGGVVLASMILTACAAPAPVVVTSAPIVVTSAPVVVTSAPQVVKETQIVAGTPQTVEKVVTVTPAPTQNPYDDNAPVTVWIDADRQPAFDAYVKAHPDKANLLKAVTVDREQFPAKVLLFNNTNQGWPDVVFAEPRLVGRVADAAHHFPLDLKPWVTADVINGYAGMDGCTFGDNVFCLRNDLAMFVLYYNKPLMDKFGYTVPTTFEEYQDLSDKVAKDHPGYYLGTFGDGWTFISYFDASGCPSHELVSDNELKIDVKDPRCIRAAKLVDHMLANGTLFNTDYFSAEFAKVVSDNKLLAMPGPAWMFGVFGGNKDSSWYKTSDHQLGVAVPLMWKDDGKAQTPAMGGAAWTVSSHTKNPKLAVDFIQWVTTNPDFWKGTTNYPAYKPIQNLWQAAVASNPLFANDPFPIYQLAATQITSLDKWPRFDLIAPFSEAVKTGLTDKKTVESILPDVADKLAPLAEAQGYQVDVTK